jgi:hypothetical protein
MITLTLSWLAALLLLASVAGLAVGAYLHGWRHGSEYVFDLLRASRNGHAPR